MRVRERDRLKEIHKERARNRRNRWWEWERQIKIESEGERDWVNSKVSIIRHKWETYQKYMWVSECINEWVREQVSEWARDSRKRERLSEKGLGNEREQETQEKMRVRERERGEKGPRDCYCLLENYQENLFWCSNNERMDVSRTRAVKFRFSPSFKRKEWNSFFIFGRSLQPVKYWPKWKWENTMYRGLYHKTTTYWLVGIVLARAYGACTIKLFLRKVRTKFKDL